MCVGSTYALCQSVCLWDQPSNSSGYFYTFLPFKSISEHFKMTSFLLLLHLCRLPASAMSSTPSEKTLPSGSDFSSKAVLCLIEAVGRRWGLYETRERSQLFQSVQEEMASKGHVLPVEKIRRKWNNLIVTYKRVKDRSRETGHAKTSWEFFDVSSRRVVEIGWNTLKYYWEIGWQL